MELPNSKPSFMLLRRPRSLFQQASPQSQPAQEDQQEPARGGIQINYNDRMRRQYQVNEPRLPRPRRRMEVVPVDRYSIISYGYAIHYFLFSLICLVMYLVGDFKKMSADEYYKFEQQFANVPCKRPMEVWFSFFLFFCPLAMLCSAFIAIFKAKNNYTVKVYTLETWFKQYKIYSNGDKGVNYPILFIDYFNLAWAIVGHILNKTLQDRSLNQGAIRDCMRDYGMTTCLMAFVFVTMGYFQLIRLLLYQGVLIHHRKTLGWLEARTRRDVARFNNGANDPEVEVKFRVIAYEGNPFGGTPSEKSSPDDQEAFLQGEPSDCFSSNATCSICCLDFKEKTPIVCLPCSVSRLRKETLDVDATTGVALVYRHTFHEKCIQSWLSRSNECPLCKENVVALQYSQQAPLQVSHQA